MRWNAGGLKFFKILSAKVHISCESCNVSSNLEEKKQKFTVSEAIATDFFLKNKISAFRFYLIIRKHFSGKFHISQLQRLAEITEQGQAHCRKMIGQLCKMEYLEQKPSGWYFSLGTRRFNLAKGYMRPRMCQVPENALKCLKQLRTFVYSIHFTKAAKQAAKGQGENKSLPSHLKGSTSISYLASYTGVCELTACRHRNRAQKFGFIAYQKKYNLLAEGDASEIKFWKEHHPLFYRSVVFRPLPGRFCLLERLPSKMVFGISSKTKSLSYSLEEKSIIKSLFIPKSSSPLGKRYRHKPIKN